MSIFSKQSNDLTVGESLVTSVGIGVATTVAVLGAKHAVSGVNRAVSVAKTVPSKYRARKAAKSQPEPEPKAKAKPKTKE